jgi:hypothetical protein
MKRSTLALVLASTAACAGLAFGGSLGGGPGVLPPKAKPYGQSYAQWTAKWWQWGLSQPVEGHPFVDSPDFDVERGQSGQVWFLAAPLDTVVRTCTIPAGKALFVGVINSEWSDLEGYLTEQEQRDFAVWYANHMRDVFVTLDGAAVSNIGNYRVESAQFGFSAPSPWIFGATGGEGNAVADGYYVFIAPPSAGSHVLHFGGVAHFSTAEGDPFDYDGVIDTTYNLTVGH